MYPADTMLITTHMGTSSRLQIAAFQALTAAVQELPIVIFRAISNNSCYFELPINIFKDLKVMPYILELPITATFFALQALSDSKLLLATEHWKRVLINRRIERYTYMRYFLPTSL